MLGAIGERQLVFDVVRRRENLVVLDVGIVNDAVLRQDHSVVKLLKQKKTGMYVERIGEK